ncbi:hypothetical protein [Megasphaera hominis]|jgi:hypothetical protein|uniref:Uncharacterized protein n=1 Tax=Megasphaera hominis TaxID=159836 RepID=A0ABR6VLS5_9FIRM|nr:hypothetical protein [Megasphaera hominis]MBC3537780.1 hypothetical protein [Megasphaera hominis]
MKGWRERFLGAQWADGCEEFLFCLWKKSKARKDFFDLLKIQKEPMQQ